MWKAWVVVLVLASGCGKNGEDQGPKKATAALAEIKGLVAEGSGLLAEHACKKVVITDDDRSKNPTVVAELDTLCKVEVPRLHLAGFVELAEDMRRRDAPDMTLSRCHAVHVADALAALEAAGKIAEVRPLLARLAVVCPDHRLPAALTPTADEMAAVVRPKWPQETSAEVNAAAEYVATKLVDARASRDANSLDLANLACTVLFADHEKLAKSPAHRELWIAAHVECFFTVPLAILSAAVAAAEAAKDTLPVHLRRACQNELVEDAYMAVAWGGRLEDDRVTAVVARWNAVCPWPKLEPKPE